jgi:hypothetical protein
MTAAVVVVVAAVVVAVVVAAAAAVVADTVKLALVLRRVLFAPLKTELCGQKRPDWQNR